MVAAVEVAGVDTLLGPRQLDDRLLRLDRDRTIPYSSAVDPLNDFIGSSPYGDRASTGIRVPTAPTTHFSLRYLFRLASVRVPPGSYGIIHDLRQFVEIGVEVPVPQGGTEPDILRPYTLEVTSPGWHFVDGNIAWFLLRRSIRRESSVRVVAAPGTAAQLYGHDTALMASVGAIGGPPYVPPWRGIPPGQAVPGLGLFHDLRFPWRGESRGRQLEFKYFGPCDLTFWASVHQTNPLNQKEPTLTSNQICCALGPEDRFVHLFPADAQRNLGVRYWRVAGAMSIEIVRGEVAT